MSIVQIQRVHRYRNGEEIVTFAENFDLSNHREYEDALQLVEHDLEEGEFSRTVGDGAPLMVRIYDEFAAEEVLTQ